MTPIRSLSRLLLLPLAVLAVTQSACGQSRFSGELDASDPTLEEGEYYDTYTLDVTAGQWIEADMTTSDFDPYLVVMAPSGHNEQNDDHEGSRERSYLRIQANESGTWQVFATSYAGGETGRYRLALNVLDDGSQPVCDDCGPVRPASQDGARYESGELTSRDNDLDSGEYFDEFTVQGRAGETLVLDLRATDFDPYLILIPPTGEQIDNDDHEGDRTRSLITTRLEETGAYRVLVTSYQPKETGAYDLTIRGGTGGTGTTFAVASGQRSETGRLASGDQALRSGEYYDEYTFEGVPGQRVTLDLRSTEFDPYLVLIPPRGESVQNDDFEGDLQRSQIQADLTEPGTYRVYVTSYAAEEVGAYQLAMDFSGDFGTGASDSGTTLAVSRTTTTLSAAELTLDESLRGSLAQSDQRLDSGEFSDLHVFDGEAGEPVRIEMTSTSFDTYLLVTTPAGELIENDDFEGSQRVSRIDMIMPMDGRYRIQATSFQPGETGDYTIRISQLDAMEPDPPAYDRIAGIFMGISDYGGRQGNLAYTAQDAHDIRNALIEGGGMRPEDGIVLTDAQATTTNFRNALRQLAARTDERTLFVLFYSGHGGQYRRSGAQPADPDGMDESIELYDAEILDDELNQLLSQLPSAQQLIVLDACFSGGFAKDVISQPGRMGLFSSEEDVVSAVAAKFEAGGYLSRFFSDALLDRAADEDGNGALTPLELSEYLRDRYRGDVRNTGLEAIVARETRLGNQHLVVDRGSFYAFSTLFVLD